MSYKKRKIYIFGLLFGYLIVLKSSQIVRADPNDWTLQTVDRKISVGQYTSMAINPTNNNPAISFYDDSGTDLMYAYYAGNGTGNCFDNNWFCETVDSAGIVGQGTALAFDSSGKAVIAYYDTTNFNLKYAIRSGAGLGSGCASATWTCETVDATGDVGQSPSIAVNTQDKPAISYYDATNLDLKYALRDGGNSGCADSDWTCEKVHAAGNSGAESAIKFKPDNQQPAIAYRRTTSVDLYYAIRSGSSGGCGAGGNNNWNCESVLTSNNYGANPSLTFNSSNQAAIASRDETTQNLMYSVRVGSGTGNGCNDNDWTCETVVASNDVGFHPSIAFNGSSQAVISHFDNTNGNLLYAVRVGTPPGGSGCNDNDWVCETVDSTGTVGDYTSIKVNSADKPIISYYDSTNAVLKYAARDDASPECADPDWSCKTIHGNNTIQTNNLAYNNSGTPAVVYYGATSTDLVYALYVGDGSGNCFNNNWNCELVDTTGDVGQYPSIAFNTSNQAVVSYYDNTNGNLKYAIRVGSAGGSGCNDSDWTCETVVSDNNVGQYTSLALNSSNQPGVSYYNVSNGNLEYALRVGSGAGTGCADNDWTCETVFTANDVGQYTHIDFNSSNQAAISFYDVTDGDLEYAFRTGNGGGSGCADTDWTCESVATEGDVGNFFTALQFNSSDQPAIAYKDHTNGDVEYALRVGSAAGSGCADIDWTCESVLTGGSVGGQPDFAFTDSDQAVIVHRDTTTNQVEYAARDGGAIGGCNDSDWSCEILDTSDQFGLNSSVAIISSALGISYRSNDTNELKLTTFSSPPVTPSVTIGTENVIKNVDINPILLGSDYSGKRAHAQTDWKIVTSSNCTSGTAVWFKNNDTVNKTTIRADSTNGSFTGALAGQTALAYNTTYYACGRYNNLLNSSWSSARSFTTATASSPYSTKTWDFTTGSDYTVIGGKTQLSSDNYTYKRIFTINNAGASTLTDYQLNFTVNSGSFLANGNDLRFFSNSDGLNHWLESISGQNANVWVKVPNLPASTSSQLVLRYGNASLSNRSSPTNTFIRDISSGSPLLVAWNFDETSGGTAADSSGNNHTGTASNTTISTGKFGNARSFNGSSSSVEDSNGANYLNGLSAFTISLWIKSNETGTDKGFVSGQTPDGNETPLSFRYDADGVSGGGVGVIKAGITVGAAINQDMESSENVQTLSWQHLVLSWASGQDLKLYINGKLDVPTYTSIARTGSLTGLTKLVIGKGGKDTASSWNGLIDDVQIYNRILTNAEVLDIYNNSSYATVNYSGKAIIRKFTSSGPSVTDGGETSESFTSTVGRLASPYQNTAEAFQRTINVNLGAGSLTDYQVKVNLSSGNFNLYNGKDFRFYDNDATTTPLKYWIEAFNASTPSATVWVKIPSIPPGGKNITLKYGYENALAQSSVTDTFIRHLDPAGTPVFLAYPMDEATDGATVVDYSGNSRNGTPSGVTTVTGKYNNGRSFNGTSNYIDMGHLPRLGMGAISFWFKPTNNFSSGASVSQPLWGFYHSNDYNAHVILKASDYSNGTGANGSIQAKIEYANNPLYLATTTTSWTGGTWYHYALIWGGGKMSVYVNGVQQSNSNSTPIVGRVTPVSEYLGRSQFESTNISSGNFLYFNGVMDEFRMYSRALNAVEVADIYNNYGYVTTNQPGKEYIRKINAIEPTVIVGGESAVDFTQVMIMPLTTLDSFVQLVGFNQNLGPNHAGPANDLKYQLSCDGSNWWYHPGGSGSWTQANTPTLPSHFSSASKINAYIGDFVSAVGGACANLRTRVYLISNSTQAKEIETAQIHYYGVPATPSISSPTASSTGVKRRPTIIGNTYNSPQTHLSTDLQIASDSGFTSIIVNCVDYAPGSGSKESIDINPANCTLNGSRQALDIFTSYYARLRYTNTYGDSLWSSTISFTTTRPVFTGSIQNQTWDEDTSLASAFDLDSYFTYAGGETTTYSIVTSPANVTITIASGTKLVSFTPTPANWFGSQSAVFRLTDSYGDSVDSNQVTLTVNSINDLPTAAQDLKPDNEIINSQSPTLTWQAATDTEDSPGNLKYAIYLDLQSNLTTSTHQYRWLSDIGKAYYKIPDSIKLSDVTKYYYVIETIDLDNGKSSLSPVANFTINTSAANQITGGGGQSSRGPVSAPPVSLEITDTAVSSVEAGQSITGETEAEKPKPVAISGEPEPQPELQSETKIDFINDQNLNKTSEISPLNQDEAIIQEQKPLQDDKKIDTDIGPTSADYPAGQSPSNPFNQSIAEPEVITMVDRDKDEIDDSWEILSFGNVTEVDPAGDNDADGLTNALEYQYQTNPLSEDSDGDGVSDTVEITKLKTNPGLRDSDHDGFLDATEIEFKTDPVDATNTPGDANGNHVTDSWEAGYNIIVKNGIQDTDQDGLSDILEFWYETSPLEKDTDADGYLDVEEIYEFKTDPINDQSNPKLNPIKLAITNCGVFNAKNKSQSPLIKGVGLSPIQLYVEDLKGNQRFLSPVPVSDNNKFMIVPDISLRDGQWTLLVKNGDQESRCRVTIDHTLDLKAPTPERISTVDILRDVRLEIKDNRPILKGKILDKAEVIATWQSLIFTSALLVDTAAGDFATLPPQALPVGKHDAYLYAVRLDDEAKSDQTHVEFEVLTDGTIRIIKDIPVYQYWILLLAILLGLGVSFINHHSRKKITIIPASTEEINN